MGRAAKTMSSGKNLLKNEGQGTTDQRRYAGLTMVEMMVAMAVGLVPMLVVGVLLVGGQRAWERVYGSAHKKIQRDAQGVAISFSSIGRKANRLDYIIYTASGGTYTPAEPATLDQEVVRGDAVEFRFWDVELDQADSNQLMDVTKQATAYAFFYLENRKLKVDYGPYPPGAVPAGSGSRNTTGVTTTILAENVTANSNTGPFSHTTITRVGQGCVRINITLTDPQDGQTVTVKTATLLRNVWPR